MNNEPIIYLLICLIGQITNHHQKHGFYLFKICFQNFTCTMRVIFCLLRNKLNSTDNETDENPRLWHNW